MTKRMTQKEALAEAKRRWGEKAVVWSDGRKPHIQRHVGYWEMGAYHWKPSSRRARGTGDSWEAAFADADKRAEFRKMNDIGNAHFRIGPGRMV